MTILREHSELAEATMADLVETWNALSGGKAIKKFETREIGRVRVENAMLAAKAADEQTGVPKGADGEVKTREEIRKKAKARGIPAPAPLDPDSEELQEESLPLGSMAADLQKSAAKMDPVAPRAPKAPGDPKVPRGTSLLAVEATFAGTSKPQQGSIRNNVLLHIQQCKAISMKDLDEHFMQPCRGFVQKLIEKSHLKIISLEDLEKVESRKDAPAPKAPAKKRKG